MVNPFDAIEGKDTDALLSSTANLKHISNDVFTTNRPQFKFKY